MSTPEDILDKVLPEKGDPHVSHDLLTDVPTKDSSPEHEVGELAIDVFEDDDTLTITAPMAGVRAQDLDLSITDETVVVKGTRETEHKGKGKNHLVQECYWGAFERTYTLPVPVDSEKAKATLKDGLLTVAIPKTSKSKTKVIEVKTE